MDSLQSCHASTQSNVTTSSTNKKSPKRLLLRNRSLQSFSLFSKLPTELRIIIWQLTLESRVIEIEFDKFRGFFTRVSTPVALRVSRDSRNATITRYPPCFGNVIYPPRTVFNFDLDTLYLDDDIQFHTLHLLAGLTLEELTNLQYLAVTYAINLDWQSGGDTDIDLVLAISKVVPKMTALKDLSVVFDLSYWPERGNPEGKGPMKLFETWPDKLMEVHVCTHEWDSPPSDFDSEGGFECEWHELPDFTTYSDYWDDIQTPEPRSIWGWRPMND
jgi:hypothetical protein